MSRQVIALGGGARVGLGLCINCRCLVSTVGLLLLSIVSILYKNCLKERTMYTSADRNT